MAARYFFLDPVYSFSVYSIMSAERLVLFIGEGTLLSGLSGEHAGARRLAEAAISQLRRSEQRLKHSIEDVRALRLTTDATVWEWDLAHDRMMRGATRTERPRTPVSTMNYRSWLEQIHPDDRSAVIASIESALRENHEEWHCEYRRLRPGGKFSYVSDHAFVFRDTQRNPERMVGRTVNLSPAHRPVHLPGVPLPERNTHAVVEQSTVAVLVTNSFLRIVSANRAAAELLGYQARELQGMPVEKLFASARSQKIAKHLSGLDPFDRPSVSFLEDCVRSDGKSFIARINSIAILNLDGFTSSRIIMIEQASMNMAAPGIS
jgi:PAS domain S-box-containing protein